MTKVSTLIYGLLVLALMGAAVLLTTRDAGAVDPVADVIASASISPEVPVTGQAVVIKGRVRLNTQYVVGYDRVPVFHPVTGLPNGTKLVPIYAPNDPAADVSFTLSHATYQLVSFVAPSGVSCVDDGTVLSCTGPATLNPGTSRTVTINAIALQTPDGRPKPSITSTSSTSDPNPVNNTNVLATAGLN